MKEIILRADDKCSGKKVKYIIRNNLGLSAGLYRRLKRISGAITIDGRETFADEILQKGQVLSVKISDAASENIEPADMPLDIIYEDEDLIILNKPRSMPTHPSMHHHNDTLANGVMNYFRGKDFTFRVITRLDRDTSGLVIVAKNAFAAQKLSGYMMEGKIKKEYAAIVCGVPKPASGVINAPIKRAEESVILRCIAKDGKEALSEYEVIKTNDKLSLVKLLPKTGRTHQLRLHMSYIGTPVYGDSLYGEGNGDGRTRLHCRKLIFPHPFEDKQIEVEAPYPEDMNMI